MSIDTLLGYLPAIAQGLWVTLFSWVIAALGGVALGLAIALVQRGAGATLRRLIQGYIEALRCTPLIVLLFIVYDGGPALGLLLDPLPAGLLVLIIHGSAYFAEIFRGGFAAVPAGQLEAANSLGMAPLAVVRRVLMPGALAAALPGLVNMVINVCKETALLSVITVGDLTFAVQNMAVETFAAFQSILALALGYWLLIELFSRLGQRAERRINRHLTLRGGASEGAV
ncbi:ABC transporter permease subunit [Pseudomonas sp. NPDC007930]|uniref:amino acid ABC transporter permease n=1 Tax=Pseudomonas sp. NPDC007930 TaxID=3364417 RepID=UPI0036EC24DB